MLEEADPDFPSLLSIVQFSKYKLCYKFTNKSVSVYVESVCPEKQKKLWLLCSVDAWLDIGQSILLQVDNGQLNSSIWDEVLVVHNVFFTVTADVTF